MVVILGAASSSSALGDSQPAAAAVSSSAVDESLPGRAVSTACSFPSSFGDGSQQGADGGARLAVPLRCQVSLNSLAVPVAPPRRRQLLEGPAPAPSSADPHGAAPAPDAPPAEAAAGSALQVPPRTATTTPGDAFVGGAGKGAEADVVYGGVSQVFVAGANNLTAGSTAAEDGDASDCSSADEFESDDEEEGSDSDADDDEGWGSDSEDSFAESMKLFCSAVDRAMTLLKESSS